MLVCSHGQEVQPRRLVCHASISERSTVCIILEPSSLTWTRLVSRFASFLDGEICRSSGEPQQKALSSMKSNPSVLSKNQRIENLYIKKLLHREAFTEKHLLRSFYSILLFPWSDNKVPVAQRISDGRRDAPKQHHRTPARD